jgi:hypothetical protein
MRLKSMEQEIDFTNPMIPANNTNQHINES